jgi:hypothetical protein
MRRWSLFLLLGVWVDVSAELSISPKVVTIGGTFTVRGTGFSASEEILVDIQGSTKTVTSSEKGEFVETFEVQLQPGGEKLITAYGLGSKRTEYGKVLVIADIEIYPKEGSVGTKIEVTGCGFGPNERIQIGLGRKHMVTSTHSTKLGTFKAEFVVKGQPKGKNQVFAIGNRTYQLAQEEFIMNSTLKISPNSGKVGSTILVSGDGFTPGDKIRIEFGERGTVALAKPDRFGSFRAKFGVPEVVGGENRMVVSSLQEEFCLTESFYVLPRIVSIGPKKGFVGDNIRVNIDGLLLGEKAFIGFGSETDYATFTAGENGVISTNFSVDTQPGGVKVITVKVADMLHTQLFEIRPKIHFVSPTEVSPGEKVIVKGCGFMEEEKIRIDCGRIGSIRKVNADSLGLFETEFSAPSGEGRTMITAVGYESHRAGIAYITIKRKENE